MAHTGHGDRNSGPTREGPRSEPAAERSAHRAGVVVASACALDVRSAPPIVPRPEDDRHVSKPRFRPNRRSSGNPKRGGRQYRLAEGLARPQRRARASVIGNMAQRRPRSGWTRAGAVRAWVTAVGIQRPGAARASRGGSIQHIRSAGQSRGGSIVTRRCSSGWRRPSGRPGQQETARRPSTAHAGASAGCASSSPGEAGVPGRSAITSSRPRNWHRKRMDRTTCLRLGPRIGPAESGGAEEE